MQAKTVPLLEKFKNNWLISSFTLIGIGAGLVFTGLEKGILPYTPKTEHEQLKKTYEELSTSYRILTIDNKEKALSIEHMSNEIKQLRDSIADAKKNGEINDEKKQKEITINQKNIKGTNIGFQNNGGK